MATASSLVGLATGFLLIGILILNNKTGEELSVAGGVGSLLLGTSFLMLTFLYWKTEALKS
jgi:hypothetical protein